MCFGPLFKATRVDSDCSTGIIYGCQLRQCRIFQVKLDNSHCLSAVLTVCASLLTSTTIPNKHMPMGKELIARESIEKANLVYGGDSFHFRVKTYQLDLVRAIHLRTKHENTSFSYSRSALPVNHTLSLIPEPRCPWFFSCADLPLLAIPLCDDWRKHPIIVITFFSTLLYGRQGMVRAIHFLDPF